MMDNKLPFEIISEKSDMDWMDANPRAYRIEYKDFLGNEEKREKAETLTHAGRLVLVKNGNEVLGAMIPKAALVVHGLFAGENTDGFFDSINNRALKKEISGEEGLDLLGKFDDDNQTIMVLDRQANFAYGFVSANFLKNNLVTDDQSRCLFKADQREAIEAGLQNWEQNFEQAFIRLEEARDRSYEDISKSGKSSLTFFYQDHFIDIIARYLNIVDYSIKEDENWISSMIAPVGSATGNQITEENTIGDPP